MKTLEEVLARVKQATAKQEKVSDAKKLEARVERAKRKSTPTTIYEREELWLPVTIHREYEVQHCDSCKTEVTVFSHQKTELQHKIDKSARKWRFDKGESESKLPLQVSFTEHVVPECFCCYSLGRFSTSLWKGRVHETYTQGTSQATNSTQSERKESSDSGKSGGNAEGVPATEEKVESQDGS